MYIQDVFISATWIFEKSIEYRFNSALVRTKTNYLLMLQDILAKHDIYTWKKVIWRKAVINIFFTDQNEYTQPFSQLN